MTGDEIKGLRSELVALQVGLDKVCSTDYQVHLTDYQVYLTKAKPLTLQIQSILMKLDNPEFIEMIRSW